MICEGLLLLVSLVLEQWLLVLGPLLLTAIGHDYPLPERIYVAWLELGFVVPVAV